MTHEDSEQRQKLLISRMMEIQGSANDRRSKTESLKYEEDLDWNNKMDATLDVMQETLAMAYTVSGSLDPLDGLNRSKERWIDMAREGLSDASIGFKGRHMLINGVRTLLAERERDKEIASEEEMQKQLINKHRQLFKEAHNAVQEGTDKTSHAKRV